ncbi:MAG TPA: DUF1080 domain-containing protein [Fibrobacteria bacterium]|nr:DUF1080 domain-containing protein [Fibrobacteria bacterium]
MLNLIINRKCLGYPRIGILVTFLVFASTLCIQCQASSAGTAADADSDFKYQGEYLGKVETVSPVLGVQVIAKGGGLFTAAFLPGGLPGAGWDTANRIEQNGTLQAGEVHFQPIDASKEYTAAISTDGSAISGKTPKGELFTLLKIFRKSPSLDSVPPANATVLFNRDDLSAFVKNSASLDSGFLLPQGSAYSGAVTVQTFGSFTLHLEFREPFEPYESGQRRGNSGIYLQGRYELQILDSFGLNIHRGKPGEETQECGAFYQLVGPSLNMSFPPLSWQTYDIEFTKAKFSADGKTQLDPAVATVRLNGVVIHDHQPLLNKTLLGDSVKAEDGPLRFQAHGGSVLFRNIWVVRNGGTAIRPAPRLKPAGNLYRLLRGEASTTGDLVSGRRVAGSLAAGCYLSREAGRFIAAP